VSERFQESARKHKTTTCLDCELCLSVCPAHRYDEAFSAKAIAEAVLEGREIPDSVWQCLTCRQCETRCPDAGVRFAYFVRDIRAKAREDGLRPRASHSGILPSVQRIMASQDLAQDRLGWVDGSLRTSSDSDTLLFVGCLPYYEDLFSDELRFDPLDSAKAAVRLLNRIGIEPILSGDEVCCGHDLLWTGDLEAFKALAGKNIETVRSLKVRRVVTLCPECQVTMDRDYRDLVGGFDAQVVHLSQVLAEGADKIDFSRSSGEAVAYWDSCRLGRFCGVYEEPRELISLAASRVVEMTNSRRDSICCGSPCFSGCGSLSRSLRDEILAEAENAGAQLLVTGCPRAEIHMRCALRRSSWQQTRIAVVELASFLASRLAP
jgi:heterodisulfide reductase subunit D